MSIAWQYFYGLLVLGVVLFGMAWLKGRHANKQTPKSQAAPDQQAALLALTNKLLINSGVSAVHSGAYLSLSKHGKKCALLTLDANLKDGSRKMGDVVVINFRRLPSAATLKKALLYHHIIQ